MAKENEFDLNIAHGYFAVACFNRTWELLDKAERTPEEDEEMIRSSLASHYHWTHRNVYSPTNKSIAHWQTSRVFAVLGQAENARHYGELSLAACQDPSVMPFYVGYAHEALARAAALAGDQEQMSSHLEEARQAAELVTDTESKKMLLDDLAGIQVP